MILIYATSILYIMVSNWIVVFSNEKGKYFLAMVPYAIMVGGVGLRFLITRFLPSIQSFSDLEVFNTVLIMGVIGFLITSISNLIVEII
jgi:hypothetical protein